MGYIGVFDGYTECPLVYCTHTVLFASPVGAMADNNRNLARDGVVVACGMSRFNPATDTKVAMVFERAGIEMYRNKKKLKSGGDV